MPGKEFRVSFKLHRLERETIRIPDGAAFMRLYYDEDLWILTLWFFADDAQPMIERVLEYNNMPPSSCTSDRYLGKFTAKPTNWYLYYRA